MAVGDQNDIASRLQSVIPPSWFNIANAQERGLLQGFANAASWVYGLIAGAKLQTRLATSIGIFLDLFAYDRLGRTILRKVAETDTAWRTRIQNALLAVRVTRAGMYNALLGLTGKSPIVFEQWNPGDAGAWASRNSPATNTCYFSWGSRGSGVTGMINGWSSAGGYSFGGAGAWGSRRMPNACFITVFRPGLQGVQNLGGWASRSNGFLLDETFILDSSELDVGPTPTLGGWASSLVSYTANSVLGAFAWISRTQSAAAVVDQDIYDTINQTKPVGVAVWVQLI